MTPTRALTRDSLGAWLLKASGASAVTQELVRTGFASVTTRCVRRSYRTDLVEPGDTVLLWVSGDAPGCPAGIHASGAATGAAFPGPEGTRGPSSLVLPVRLAAVDPPVLRAELRSHPVLSSMEVLRMPAGSNPSYLTKEQLDALCSEWPEVAVHP